jgi:outer membrane immunogenic protein
MVKASALLAVLLVAGATAPTRAGDVPAAPPPPPPSPVSPPDANPWSGLTIGSEVFGISGKGLKSHVGGGGFADWSRYYPDGSFVAFSGGAGFSPAFFPTGWATGPGGATGYDFTTLGVRAGQDFGRLKTFMFGSLQLSKPSAGPAGAPSAMGSIDNVFSAPSRLRARNVIGAGFEYQVTDRLMVGGTVSASQGRGPFAPPSP